MSDAPAGNTDTPGNADQPLLSRADKCFLDFLATAALELAREPPAGE